MHKITFFPLCKEGARPANAETFRIDLNNGSRKILGDFACTHNPDDTYELRCDLPQLLRDDLKATNRDYYDVVMFTHLDDDHVCGAGEFFYFERYTNRQSADRIKINELWVPAAAICETNLDNDAELIRAEARYRLKQKKGIKVFSAPKSLTKWCEDNDLDIEELQRLGLVIDAGNLVPGFDLYRDGAEFFVHSPFAYYTDDGQTIIRNRDAIVMQVTFEVSGELTRFLITADVKYDVLDDIVMMTQYHNNEERLTWDIIDLPHHSSYTGVGPEKGESKTDPSEGVKWLHKAGSKRGILVSSSCCIPLLDTVQPPHVQAARYYEDVARDIGQGNFYDEGVFVVTMEYPTKGAPKPLVIEITSGGAALVKQSIASVGAAAVAVSAPRVG